MEFCGSTLQSIPTPGYGAGTAWYKGAEHNSDNSPLDENQIEQTVLALQAGFKHLDLAEMYGNDREVGEALRRYLTTSNRQRSDVWITHKCFENLNNPIKGAREMIQRLDCQYLDLYLLHAPLAFAGVTDVSISKVWSDMESLVDQGLVRFIGISNFRIQDIEELMAIPPRIAPYIIQIEFNPYLQQPELYKKCDEYGIKIAAYSPLGPLNLWPGGPLDPVLEELSQKYQQSTSVILLKYTSQKGVVPITTTSKLERMNDYLSAFAEGGFQLSPEDIQRIEEVGKTQYKRKYLAPLFGDSQA